MKLPILGLLLGTLALTSCQTAHRAAVSTFRVIDAPHQYIRRALAVDENDNGQSTTTTTTTETYAAAPNTAATYPQPYREQAPPPPQVSQRQVVTQAPPPPQRPPLRREVVTTEREHAPEPTATPAPRVTSRSTTNSSASTSHESTETKPRTTSASTTGLPYGKPVPGKSGYVYSPYDKNGGYVDVTGFAPGSKVKDPYSGKIFLVP